MTEPSKSFGPRLRWWRDRRGLSQLDLASAAGTTQRHLSLAAGYAPLWRESDLSAPELARVDSALDYMVAQQEPYPAFTTAWVFRGWAALVGQPA